MLLNVENLNLSFEKKRIFHNASFRILPNEKVGLIGNNGVGKSTLINILCGNIIPDGGNIEFDKSIKVGYLDQYMKVDKKLNIDQYLKQAFKQLYEKDKELKEYLEIINTSDNEVLIDRYVRLSSIINEELENKDFYALDSKIARIASGLGITKYGMNSLMGNLSGGQKMKVILAKLLLEQPDLLILDEPTNFLDTIHIDEGERTNYIKFLDFTYEKNLDVNLEDFEERMEIRPMDSNGEVKLNFEVGKATLNPNDTANTRILAGARRELSEAFRQSSSKLKFMQVFGYSSPEGNPQSNLDLARRRADFALNEIKTAIPYNMHKAIRPSESMILGWDVVADSLQRDGLTEEAQQVRDIVAKYPDNLVNQGYAVQRLPYYATIIKPIYLPKLRTVKYTYTKVEDRTLSQQELIQMFDAERDNEFNRAHYYHLIEYYWDDRKEPETRARLEEIAKRALVNTRLTKDDLEEGDSLYNEGYWALAANILATSYIERDTFDLDILRPFINRKLVKDSITGGYSFAERVGVMKQKFDFKGEPIGVEQYTNFPVIIAEQMIMLLMQPGHHNREELDQLTDMIENEPKCMNDPMNGPTYRKMLALANKFANDLANKTANNTKKRWG